MKKFSVIAAGLALVVMLASSAMARPQGQGKGYGPGNQAYSQEEIQKFQEQRAQFLKETLELRKQMAVKSVELRTLYAQPKADQAQIKALANELIDLRAQIAKKRTNLMGNAKGFGRGFGGRGSGRRGFGGCGGPGGGQGGGPGAGFAQGSCWR